jgi:hypothetical protein
MGILIFVALSLCITLVILHSQRKARKLIVDDWDTLVASLQSVPFQGLEAVALEHLQPVGSQVGMQPDELWQAVGGYEGLRRMQHNTDVIIRLAAYVSRWNYTEAAIVAERIRQDSIILKRAFQHIERRALFAKHQLRLPFYVQQAASSYYLMTRRLLALYETNQYILYPRLSAAL